MSTRMQMKWTFLILINVTLACIIFKKPDDGKGSPIAEAPGAGGPSLKNRTNVRTDFELLAPIEPHHIYKRQAEDRKDLTTDSTTLAADAGSETGKEEQTTTASPMTVNSTFSTFEWNSTSDATGVTKSEQAMQSTAAAEIDFTTIAITSPTVNSTSSWDVHGLVTSNQNSSVGLTLLSSLRQSSNEPSSSEGSSPPKPSETTVGSSTTSTACHSGCWRDSHDHHNEHSVMSDKERMPTVVIVLSVAVAILGVTVIAFVTWCLVKTFLPERDTGPYALSHMQSHTQLTRI